MKFTKVLCSFFTDDFCLLYNTKQLQSDIGLIHRLMYFRSFNNYLAKDNRTLSLCTRYDSFETSVGCIKNVCSLFDDLK